MKRGLKALAVLAAVAMASAGPLAFAVCSELGGFAIFQCAERAWFEPPPAGAGAVTSAFWQIGYGNNTLNTGLGSSGTGMSGLTTFNGNDSGNWNLELVDARARLNDTRVPLGALCLSNNNWGNAGIDGCSDDFRDPGLPGGTGDDGILNPLYDVYYARNGYPGQASNGWVVDYPIAVLLKEASGHWFAIAAVATMPRTGPDDLRVGDFNFKWIANGTANPITTGVNNIVPWQRIPGDRDPADPATNFVVAATFVPGNTNTTKVLDLQWSGVTIHSDLSTRPTTNSTMFAPGAGTADMPGLVRFVVETQAVVDGNNPYGTLNPAGWAPVLTVYPPAHTAQITVNPDTCVRLHTYFGKEPQPVPPSNADCRLGKCGDLGYEVFGHPACIGGPLASDGTPGSLNAVRKQGNVEVTWKTTSELSVNRFDVYAVTKKGNVKVAEAACSECMTGQGGNYKVTIPAASLKGARTLEVVAVGPNVKASTTIK